MRLAERILDYINAARHPVSREELRGMFSDVMEHTYDAALVEVRKATTRQRIKMRGYRKGLEVFIPLSLLGEYESEMVPRTTAKGICLLPTKEQDIYPAVCYELCHSFGSCAPLLKTYHENNGIRWRYDGDTARLKKISRLFSRHPI
jgi:hypothetical protein